MDFDRYCDMWREKFPNERVDHCQCAHVIDVEPCRYQITILDTWYDDNFEGVHTYIKMERVGDCD